MATSEIALEEFRYRHGELELVGLRSASAGEAPRPGVLVVPAVFGMTDHSKNKARRIAELGYTVFIADLFGAGRSFDSLETAMGAGGPLMADVPLWRSRLVAALEALRAQPDVDATRIGAIGFCFGGTGVLELACAGEDLSAAISIHGDLKLSDARAIASVKPSILIATGADDPLVSDGDVAALQEHLRSGKGDWQICVYGNALHAFSDPAADFFGVPVAGYNALADRRCWLAMVDLFDQTLG